MLLHIHPKDPQPRLIRQVVESLQKGGIIIYPTDTVYGPVSYTHLDVYKRQEYSL